MVSCSICGSRKDRDASKSYFRVPKAVSYRSKTISKLASERREKWCDVLQISSQKDNLRVCSAHFISGQPARLFDTSNPDWVPSRNLKVTVVQQAPRRVKSENTHAAFVTCRLCAKSIDDSKVINLENNASLLKDIQYVTAQVISDGDLLPKSACKDCVKRLRLCAKWKREFDNVFVMLNSKSLENANMNYEGSESNEYAEVQSSEMESEASDDYCSESACGTVTGTLNPTTLKKTGHDEKLSMFERSTLTCAKCYSKHESIDELSDHKWSCRLFACRLCKPQEVFRDRASLKVHKAELHSQLAMCHVCGKSYAQSYLKRHFRNHFEPSVRCPVRECGQLLKNKVLFRAHLETVHLEHCRSSRLCPLCGLTVRRLQQHLKTHDKKLEPRFGSEKGSIK